MLFAANRGRCVDAREVFEGDGASRVFRVLYDLLGDTVIFVPADKQGAGDNGAEPFAYPGGSMPGPAPIDMFHVELSDSLDSVPESSSLLIAGPYLFKAFSRARSASRLKLAPHPQPFPTYRLKAFRRIRRSIGENGDVHDSEVDTEHAAVLVRFGLDDVDGENHVELAAPLAVLQKRARAQLAARERTDGVVVEQYADLLSLSDYMRGERDFVKLLRPVPGRRLEGRRREHAGNVERAAVVLYRGVLPERRRLVQRSLFPAPHLLRLELRFARFVGRRDASLRLAYREASRSVAEWTNCAGTSGDKLRVFL